jgi:hypothetical protein
VPLWDEIVPYSSVGEESKAVIEQGAGLLFVTFEKGKQITHSIPTSWVTYTFKNSEGGIQIDNDSYQKTIWLIDIWLEQIADNSKNTCTVGISS